MSPRRVKRLFIKKKYNHANIYKPAFSVPAEVTIAAFTSIRTENIARAMEGTAVKRIETILLAARVRAS